MEVLLWWLGESPIWGFSEIPAECTFGPAEPPAALVELAQDLLQLISGLRKPSVVCHFFHPLFFSAFRPFPCQSCSTSSSGAGRKLLWKRADITGVFPLLLLGLGWPSSCVPVRRTLIECTGEWSAVSQGYCGSQVPARSFELL